MDVQVRQLKEEDRKRFLATVSAAFSDERSSEEDDKRWETLLDMARCYAAFDEDTMVGTTGSFAFDMTIPGGELPCGGVTMVGVLASHRRRGIVTKLMKVQLDDLRERGEPLAALWASEAQIYPRFGYGLGTISAEAEIARDRAKFASDRPVDGSYRILDPDEALKVLPEVYDRMRTRIPGTMTRTEDWWRGHRLYDPKQSRHGAGPLFRVVWEQEGRAEAYALYRVRQKWEDAVPKGETEVLELMATSPDAHYAMWKYVFGVDLVETITYWVMQDRDPLLLMLAEMRRLKARLHDGIWIRLVDAREALAKRAYASDGAVVIELRDALCPWNEGRFELSTSGGRASVGSTDKAPDISLGPTELAAAYLGTFSFAELARAGQITASPDATRAADALFHTDISPWNPEIF